MTREIDVTITVEYEYLPPEPAVNYPGKIEFDIDRALEGIKEAIEDDLRAQAEGSDHE